MKQLNKNKKPLILTLVIVAVVLLIGYFAFAYISKAAWPFISTDNSGNSSENYSPPTEQEITDSQDAKKNNQNQNTQDEDKPSTQTAPISVAIAYAGFDETENAIDIRAFIPDIIEGNGTCTATLTQNGQTVTRSSKSFIDSTTSQCEAILIPINEFPASGTWKLVVSYESDKYTGVSSQMDVEVAL